MTDSTPLERKIERMEQMVMGPIVGSGADWRDRLEQTWRELRAALDASGNDERWQTIETAPRDGTHIDVWYAPKSPEGAALIPCRVAYAFCEDGRWYYQGSDGLGVRLWQEPTHWQPLPEPPATIAPTQEPEQ